mmetsp:Transcript_21543/g.25935  ORF Transcript_21543/g.25935 Transcript_21543/m.25935 type:complete len:531 (-) Transcript_21543:417-2009(-)|eukprot:CAMPEP_0197865634 /NCGR_PEP_ID=MMETSP1438-20131217/43774_1 /TAXON_ID=1461541 /ORGANISM="Pterosperma sp., Strain CCMP1384" /LENGTH=530 /DNA_ID=CAMNT_0043484123 /DNA_START=324 /DNA_END=1916 /DNA_ORIENTATION=-
MAALSPWDRFSERVLQTCISLAYTIAPVASIGVLGGAILLLFVTVMGVGAAFFIGTPILWAVTIVLTGGLEVLSVMVLAIGSGSEEFNFYGFLAIVLYFFLPIQYTYATLAFFAYLTVRGAMLRHKNHRVHKLAYDENDKVMSYIFKKMDGLIHEYNPWWGYTLLEYCGNVSTIVQHTIRQYKVCGITYRRENILIEEGQWKGVTISLDWLDRFDGKREAPDNRPDVDSEYNRNFDKPILVISHGNAGGSDVDMALHTAHYIRENTDYMVVYLLHRGCSGNALSNQCAMNPERTWDITFIMEFLRKRFPKAIFLGHGMSLGAILVAKYAGQMGEKNPFTAISVTGCPWEYFAYAPWYDIWSNATLLPKNMTYFRKIKESLKEQEGKGSGPHGPWPAMNLEAIEKARTIREWNEEFVVPFSTENLKDVYDLYYYMSPAHWAKGIISTPLLSVHSADDPVCDTRYAYNMHAAGTAGTRQAVAAYGFGGHCSTPGFIDGSPIQDLIKYGPCHGDKLMVAFFEAAIDAKKKGMF